MVLKILALKVPFLACLHCGGGKIFGWPTAATVRKFGPRSYSTFFSSMDPLTNDGFPGSYLQFSKISPPMGPHR